MAEPTTTPADSIFRDFAQFTLFGNGFNEKNRPARMVFGTTKEGQPRITLFPGVDANDEFKNPRKVIGVGISPPQFEILLDEMEALFKNGEQGARQTLEIYTKDQDKAKNRKFGTPFTREELLLDATFFYGVDNEGFCWMALQHRSIPNIRMVLKVSAFYSFTTKDGSYLSETDVARRYAVGWVRALRRAYSSYVGAFRDAARAGDAAASTGAPTRTTATNTEADYEF